MMELLNGIFGFGFNMISLMFTIILAITVGISASAKGRSGLLWGTITLFLPITALVVFFLPRKVPKFNSYLKDEPAFKDKNPVVASMMALSAIVAKADGHVSKGEVELIRRFLTSSFNISSQDLATYQGAFEYGKDHPDEYQEFVSIIKTYYNDSRFALNTSYLLLAIGLNDHKISQQEELMIKKIVVGLGLTEYEYLSLKNYFTHGAFTGFSGAYSRGTYGNGFYGKGPSEYDGQRTNTGRGINQVYLADKYAKILGVDKSASIGEIKKAYRHLAKEYHPDKMAADGMPEEYMKYANERISEINEAYEFLKKYKEVESATSGTVIS